MPQPTKVHPRLSNRFGTVHRPVVNKHHKLYQPRIFSIIIIFSICYGLLIPYYDSTIYGRVIFQCLIPPILNVCGVYFLAQFSLPKFEHTFNHKLAYGATVFLSIGIKIVAVFGVGSERSKLIWHGVYDAFAEGFWTFVLWFIYTSRDPDYNETYMKYIVAPLYLFSTIYSLLSGFSGYASLSSAAIWGTYSILVGIFVFYDCQANFFRRKFNHPTLGWIQTPIGFDGPYFSYYVFMAISVGPGIGIMLAYLVDSDPAYYEAVMKSIGLQFFGVIIVNIVERVSLRASSETRCNSLAFQFYFVIDLIQAIMYIETEALGFSFLKVAMVQQVGSLFLHSGLKEVLLWILGIAYNDKIPLVDKTQLQVKKMFEMNLFIQGTTFLSAFMIFAFEDLAVESAPTYTMSKRNSTGMVEWSFEGTGCAVTCLGFRVHQGVPIEKSQGVVMNRSVTDAANVLGAAFAVRLIIHYFERRLCKKLHVKLDEMQNAVDEKLERMHSERTHNKEVTIKLTDMDEKEFSMWMRGHYVDILKEDACRVGLEEVPYVADDDFGLDKMIKDNLWGNAELLRKAVLRKCLDAKEFGVIVTRQRYLEQKKRTSSKEEADVVDDDKQNELMNDVIGDFDYSSFHSIPTSFLVISLWMGVHQSVMAMRSAIEVDVSGDGSLVFEKVY